MHDHADRPTLTLAIALASLAACTVSAEAPPSQAAEPPPSQAAEAPSPGSLVPRAQRHLLRAPVVVRVDGPTQVTAGQELELDVVIERTVKGTALDLAVVLPTGAELVRGQARERIDGDAERITRKLGLRLPGGVPREDLTITVDTGDARAGAHATAAYRFGRPAPTLAQPPRMGRPIRLNGRRIADPILLGR